ncbi:double-strand break repair protein AddB [Cohaesibacter gelatinilyticus]|uniref:double-strand break repair protein AddB n=1 Tax=Cohaesibacter gelatinilyticus TaxID=372072 RepID=UPI001481E333|nr:double-strand break repair protein AddB [Cohaesibacter gelatinilyticus]
MDLFSYSSNISHPNVYSISPGSGFLATMIDSLIDGDLIPNFDGSDPGALASVTIYVPTRRTANALKEAFVSHLRLRGWPSIILPRIHVIGDVDEDLLPLKVSIGVDDGFWSLPSAMDPLERRLIMTQLVHFWAQKQAREILRLDPKQRLNVSSTPSDAAYLAIDLLALIDAVHREESDWSLLGDLVPDDYGAYWQMSLEFLKIATQFWPAILTERELVDPVERRNAVLSREIEALKGHTGPVIAAGSTGSVPATADLLVAVANHPKGALILPGLDYQLDEQSWLAIGHLHPLEGQGEGVAGHPQFNLKQLLDRLKLTRGDVRKLGSVSHPLSLREKLVSEALRPAESTDLWKQALDQFLEADRQIALLDVALARGANEQEEARICALALRETLADKGKKAALVTPDRALARRVMVELKRWNIEVEDSAGMPLGETPPALLMRLMLDCVLQHMEPVSLLALIKHPLASLGMERSQARRAARFIEVELLRGPRLGGGLQTLLNEFANRREERHAKDPETPLPQNWDLAKKLLENLQQSLGSLETLVLQSEEPQPLSDWIKHIIACVEAIAANEEADPQRFYDEEAGRAMRSFFERIQSPASENIMLGARDVEPFLVAMMSGETVLDHGSGHPRLQLLGTLEARLMDVDRVVIGGLNEGSWPAQTKSDAWLSRPMRAGMKLEPPERRTGLAAHDFAQSMGRREVILVRSEKSGGSPTVPSRWILRLEAVAGREASDAMVARGEKYIRWARQLDAPRAPKLIPRPNPKPPLEHRPRNLSVTEIETWVRDPYALYAKHVLGLRQLDDIGSPPGGAEKGSIIHDVLGDFTQNWEGPFDQRAYDHLIELGRSAFTRFENFPDLLAIWWPRFERIAHWFIFEWEARRNDDVASRFAEIAGGTSLPMRSGSFHLRGRADRLDIMKDGSLSVIDFKTGQPPSAKQVLPGFAPQLALEGYMAKLGGFKDIPRSVEVSDMAWIKLSGGRKAGEIKSGVEKDYAAEDIVELIGKRLLGLIVAYDNPSKGYMSRARPMFERFESPYDHLARVKEWSQQSEGDE